jgi:hypothetical protein
MLTGGMTRSHHFRQIKFKIFKILGSECQTSGTHAKRAKKAKQAIKKN